MISTNKATEQGLAGLFGIQNGIFANALDGIDDRIALQRPNPQVNHINWLIGHLVTCRYMLANDLGVSLPDPNGKLYFSPINDLAEYRSLEELAENWKNISEALMARLDEMTGEDWEAEIPGKPVGARDYVAFYGYHEAYHLGQIAYARKLLGADPMKPY